MEERQVEEALTKEAEAREVLEQRVTKLEESSALPSSGFSELADRGARIAELEARTIDDYSAEDKASFVVPWLQSLDDAGLATLGQHTGLSITRVAEAEEEPEEEAEAEEQVEIVGEIPEGEDPNDYSWSENLGGYIHIQKKEG